MYELTNDDFYHALSEFPDCCLDYCLMKDDASYCGEISHRKAVLFAIERFSQSEEDDGPLWTYDIEKAKAAKITAAELLNLPDTPLTKKQEWKDGSTVTSYLKGDKLTYCFAFLEPPHLNGYTRRDYLFLNGKLFPSGADCLDVYEWTTDWSDYFDDGHEWWGAACWSIYDRSLGRYAVIMASATD